MRQCNNKDVLPNPNPHDDKLHCVVSEQKYNRVFFGARAKPREMRRKAERRKEQKKKTMY